MRVYEQIYTSAPRLLDGEAGSNLGVVARTRGFPAAVETELARLRSYTLLRSLSVDDPARHPVRLILSRCGREHPWYAITRVVYAGADHTGRTTPLAHHLLFDVEEMRRAGAAPAAVLSACAPWFVDSWQHPPTWIDPPRELGAEGLRDDRWQPSEAWSRVAPQADLPALLATAADALVSFAADGRAVVLVVPVACGRDVPRLVADLLAVLPVTVQCDVACVSHVVEPQDALRDAALVVTYPDTHFYRTVRERRDARAPLVISLAGPEGAPSFAARSQPAGGVYGPKLLEALRTSDARALADLKDTFDRLAESRDTASFDDAWQLRRALAQFSSPEQLPALASRAAAVAHHSQAAQKLAAQWVAGAFAPALDKLSERPRAAMLASIATDRRWPDAVRAWARKASSRDVGRSLDAAASAPSPHVESTAGPLPEAGAVPAALDPSSPQPTADAVIVDQPTIVPPRRPLNLAALSAVLAVVLLATLGALILTRRLPPNPAAGLVAVGALTLWAVVEIALWSVRVPVRLLAWSRRLRWGVIGLLLVGVVTVAFAAARAAPLM